MSVKHLTFEDMYNFLMERHITDENRTKLFAVNRHLLRCPTCDEQYQYLTALHEIASSWTLERQAEAEQQLEYMKICLSLTKAKEKLPRAISVRLSSWLHRSVECSAKVKITLFEQAQMRIEKMSAMVSPSTPYRFAYSSIGALRGGEQAENRQIVIDRNNAFNKIQVTNDRDIIVRLKLPRDITPPLIALVFDDDKEDANVCMMEYNTDQSLWELCLENLPPASCQLLIEADG